MAEQVICNHQVGGSIPLASSINLGVYSSGQRGQTVNLLAMPAVVQVPSPALVGFLFADVAQQVEYVLGKDEVTGSSPVVGSTLLFPSSLLG